MIFFIERISIFFPSQFEGRKYCEHDFQMLFAPCCRQCGEDQIIKFLFSNVYDIEFDIVMFVDHSFSSVNLGW